MTDRIFWILFGGIWILMPLWHSGDIFFSNTIGYRTAVNLSEILISLVILLQVGFKEKITPLMGILLSMALASSISIMNANNFALAIVRQTEMITHLLFAFMIAIYLKNKRVKLQQFSIISSFQIVFVTVLIIVFGICLDSNTKINWINQTPFFSHIRHYGIVLVAVIPLLLGLLENPNSKWIKNYTLFALLLLWSALFWTGGRGVIIAIMPAILYFGWRWKSHKRLLQTHISTILLGILFSQLFGMQGFSFAETIERSSKVQEYTTRASIWENLTKLWLNSPTFNKIFGQGADIINQTLPSVLMDYPTSIIQAHNLYIQILLEWGLFGLIGFISLLIYFGRGIYKNRKTLNTWEISFVFSLLSLLIIGLVDGSIYHSLPLAWFALGFGSLLPVFQSKNPLYLPKLGWVFLFTLPIIITVHTKHYESCQLALKSTPFTTQDIQEFKSWPSGKGFLDINLLIQDTIDLEFIRWGTRTPPLTEYYYYELICREYEAKNLSESIKQFQLWKQQCRLSKALGSTYCTETYTQWIKKECLSKGWRRGAF